jgi:hypothetical protein
MDINTLSDMGTGSFGNRLTERKLHRGTISLSRLREELVVVQEQLDSMEDDARDLEIRCLVAETPLAAHEFQEAQRHVQAMQNQRNFLVASIEEILVRQDELLDRLGR